MRKTINTTILATLLLTSSCVSNVVQHQHKTIGKDGWKRNDTITFELPHVKEDGIYDIRAELRTTTTFPYSKVYIAYKAELVRPLAIHCDTICIETSSHTTQGHHGGVTIKAYSNAGSKLALHEGQSGVIKIYHIMSEENIPNLVDVGMKCYLP